MQIFKNSQQENHDHKDFIQSLALSLISKGLTQQLLLFLRKLKTNLPRDLSGIDLSKSLDANNNGQPSKMAVYQPSELVKQRCIDFKFTLATLFYCFQTRKAPVTLSDIQLLFETYREISAYYLTALKINESPHSNQRIESSIIADLYQVILNNLFTLFSFYA
jgi:hypothetical protein